MTGPTTPERAPGGVLDFIVMPEGVPAGDAALGAPGGPGGPDLPEGVGGAAADTAARPGPWRAIGAFVFWSVVQTIPLLPRGLDLNAATYRPLFPPFAGTVWAIAVGLAFLWRFAWRGGAEAAHRRDTFRLRPMPSGVAARLPLVALPLLVCVVTSLVVMPRFVPVPPETDDPLQRYLKLPFGLFAVVALAAFVAPLLEEFLFRGWIQRHLERRVAPFAAILTTAALFSAVHGQLFGFPIRLVFGLTAGYVAWSTRSIWPGVVLHAVYNATLLLGGSAGPDISEGTLTTWSRTPSIFWPSLAAFVVASLLLVAALRVVARAARDDRQTRD